MPERFWSQPEGLDWSWKNLESRLPWTNRNRKRGFDVTWQPARGELMRTSKQSLYRGISQTAVRRCWLSLWNVWLSQSHWLGKQINFNTMSLPILQHSCRLFFFGAKASHHPGLSANLQPRFGPLRLLAFPKATIAFERGEICECDGH